MVMGGADAYFWVFTVVLGLAGQPALAAAAFASAWSWASDLPAALAVVDVVDFLGELLPFDTAKTIPTMTPATTTTMMALRICLRRLAVLASAASRASLAARWRARLSLGTGADPSQ